jgi:hypothetical protein
MERRPALDRTAERLADAPLLQALLADAQRRFPTIVLSDAEPARDPKKASLAEAGLA